MRELPQQGALRITAQLEEKMIGISKLQCSLLSQRRATKEHTTINNSSQKKRWIPKGLVYLSITVFLIFLASIKNFASAQQLFSCKNAKGSTTYQDFPCGANEGSRNSAVASPPPNSIVNSANTSPGGANKNSYIAEVARDFNAALSSGNLEKARRLASSSTERNAVEDARQQEILNEQRQGNSKKRSGFASGCYRSTIQKPQPFLGTAEEVIVLLDGSIWQDHSYKYLYLYAYSPQVVMCPSQGKMVLDSGGTQHVFSVSRLN